MLKYCDTIIGFAEIPDEISLCINFSNCPNKCKGCHSAYLQEDIGEYLTIKKLDELISSNKGITCVCLMGGDNNPFDINNLANLIKNKYNYKVAWYSGEYYIDEDISLENFDYIKLGSYNEKLGGLNSPNTNQRMYKIENITNKFWRNETN